MSEQLHLESTLERHRRPMVRQSGMVTAILELLTINGIMPRNELVDLLRGKYEAEERPFWPCNAYTAIRRMLDSGMLVSRTQGTTCWLAANMPGKTSVEREKRGPKQVMHGLLSISNGGVQFVPDGKPDKALAYTGPGIVAYHPPIK